MSTDRTNAETRALRKFGAAMKRLREEAGLSQEEAAHRSGLDRSYYGTLERGERNPTLTSMLKVARGLKCRVRDLISTADL